MLGKIIEEQFKPRFYQTNDVIGHEISEEPSSDTFKNSRQIAVSLHFRYIVPA